MHKKLQLGSQIYGHTATVATVVSLWSLTKASPGGGYGPESRDASRFCLRHKSSMQASSLQLAHVSPGVCQKNTTHHTTPHHSTAPHHTTPHHTTPQHKDNTYDVKNVHKFYSQGRKDVIDFSTSEGPEGSRLERRMESLVEGSMMQTYH
jgi:hypothetical protein